MVRTVRWVSTVVGVLVVAGLCIRLLPAALGAEKPIVIPAPLVDNTKAQGPLQTAVLAGGCFWGVQGVYQHMWGVRQVLSGYSGGTRETANYERVSRGGTDHAEAVEIRFDPREVSYGEILHVYFSVVHDPTQLDRQGPDTGPQYRSHIFYADSSQRRIAEAYIGQLERAKVFRRAIVTRLDRLTAFYPAEAYHQDFMLRNPGHPYIAIHDAPKLVHLKTLFPARYREQPVQTSRE
jgi:peptide-methionine (S)-S-oxide reductase